MVMMLLMLLLLLMMMMMVMVMMMMMVALFLSQRVSKSLLFPFQRAFSMRLYSAPCASM